MLHYNTRTVADAKTIFSKKLRFGDREHIRAKQILIMAALVHEKYVVCLDCDGEGLVITEEEPVGRSSDFFGGSVVITKEQCETCNGDGGKTVNVTDYTTYDVLQSWTMIRENMEEYGYRVKNKWLYYS